MKRPDLLSKKGYCAPHLVVLSVCSAILIGALFLSPPEAGEEHLTIGPLTIPETCMFKNLTGIPCPGCGLTRSMVAAAHGNMRQSFHYHRLGLLTLFYILLQFVYRIGALSAPALTNRVFGPEKHLNHGIIILAALILLNWIFSLIF